MQRGLERLERAWTTRGAFARAMLPLAASFAVLSGCRRWMYRAGWLRVEHLPVPVIVVGNLVAGGAGKTPTVLALVALLVRHGHAPGIVSRGYGGSAAMVLSVQPETPARLCGDEPLLLRRRSGVPVFVGRDRIACARALLRAHPRVDVVVSDDGLQHLRLGRNVQVLVFDERGVGNGWLLPAGPLREPLPAVVPASSLVLYNAAGPTTQLPGTVGRRHLVGAVGLQGWWRGDAADPAALAALRGRPVLVAAGVARPERFLAMLREAGLSITALALPDHYDYASLPWPATATDVVVTEKDAVKLDPLRIGTVRVWVAALDFVPAREFDTQVLRLLGHSINSVTRSAHGNPTA